MLEATCHQHFRWPWPSCQGRSKSRPPGRSKSRPVEYVEDLRFVGEEGVWSGGLRRLQGGAFRPELKTSSSPRRVRRSAWRAEVESGGWWIRSSAVSLACACSASDDSSRRSSPECGRGG